MNPHITEPGKKPVAVVTGASRGIGRSIAVNLAENGYNLAIACHNNEALLQNTAAVISASGRECITYCGDLSVSSNVHSFFLHVMEQYGHVDVLINNAGISYWGLLSDMSDEEWDRVIGTNLNSVFYCCREVIPHMVNRQSGHILNISSVWGQYGASCEAAYSAAKGGVNAFTRALAKELAPSNIQVNAIACGLIDTDMNSRLTEEDLHALYDEIPCGRAGSPDEVALLAHSLCSQSPYLTGQIISIDGGWF